MNMNLYFISDFFLFYTFDQATWRPSDKSFEFFTCHKWVQEHLSTLSSFEGRHLSLTPVTDSQTYFLLPSNSFPGDSSKNIHRSYNLYSICSGNETLWNTLQTLRQSVYDAIFFASLGKYTSWEGNGFFYSSTGAQLHVVYCRCSVHPRQFT